MDIFNNKKICELQTEIEQLKAQIEQQRIDLDLVRSYLITNGRKKTVDGKLISCFEAFLNNHKGDNDNGSV